MAAATTRRSPSKRSLSPHQINQAVGMSQAGVSQRSIATALQVSQGTINRYLSEVSHSTETIERVRDNIGDVLHLNHVLNQHAVHKVLTNLTDDAVFASLTPREKMSLLQICHTGSGIMFDKIRLHEGKSTGNISHRVLLEQTCQDEWTTKGKALKVSGDDEKPQ